MLKINERFSAKRYNRGWELHEKVKGHRKATGEVFEKSDVTYYPNFNLLTTALLDKSLDVCEELAEVKSVVEEKGREIVDAVKATVS